jgi:hypothetical protein
VGAAGGMPASPLPPTPTLPYTVLFICEHFENFVRELLVNFASGLFSILVCKVFLCVHNACAYSMLSCSIVHTHHFQMFYLLPQSSTKLLNAFTSTWLRYTAKYLRFAVKT